MMTMQSPPRRAIGVPIMLGVLALVIAGVAVWFGLESSRVADDADRLTAESARLDARKRAITDGVDIANTALSDPAKTSEVLGAVRGMIEKAFSYDYRDLGSTAEAVEDNFSGKARCQYDRVFGQLRELAPAQKLVLTTRVREIGAPRVDGDRADLLVFVDQTTTRGDQNQSTASGAQFGLTAERQDGRWKITQIDMLGQPLPNGEAGPQC